MPALPSRKSALGGAPQARSRGRSARVLLQEEPVPPSARKAPGIRIARNDPNPADSVAMTGRTDSPARAARGALSETIGRVVRRAHLAVKEALPTVRAVPLVAISTIGRDAREARLAVKDAHPTARAVRPAATSTIGPVVKEAPLTATLAIGPVVRRVPRALPDG